MAVTVAIAGLGSRGRDTYGSYALANPNKIKVVAAADIISERRNEARGVFDLPDDKVFDSAEALLKAEKQADALFICTPDDNHYAAAMAALEKGYHLLLEKPIATQAAQCADIAAAAEKFGRHVAVCHVLRYSPFYAYIKEEIASGRIGEVVHIDAVENVGYFHQAHSFVRGNWSDTKKTCPMILAKCCHDADILMWLMDEPARRVSSFGGLSHFKREKAPEGSAERCLDCGVRENCPYDALKIYLTNEHTGLLNGNRGWPVDVLARPVTEENVRKALRTGAYGRCVYACGNDAVDHQTVNIEFTNGATAHLTMAAFSDMIFRTIRVMGTHGEIEGDMRTNLITTTVFGQEPQTADVTKLAQGLDGHGGGDWRMVDAFASLSESGGEALTNVKTSVQSHLVCFAAETSRLDGGKPVNI